MEAIRFTLIDIRQFRSVNSSSKEC